MLTVPAFEAALAFYRDALGLEELHAWEAQAGRIAILGAGSATLELVDEAQAAAIDDIEVGHRVAGPVRIALEVGDSAGVAARLAGAGGAVIGGPVETPWRDRNVRVQAPDGMQLTLFTALDG